MADYSIFLKASAAEELENVTRAEDRRRILERIEGLADNPRPAGSIKLAGRDDRRRIRQGDYRIVYAVDDPERTVTVFKIGPRKDVCR